MTRTRGCVLLLVGLLSLLLHAGPGRVEAQVVPVSGSGFLASPSMTMSRFEGAVGLILDGQAFRTEATRQVIARRTTPRGLSAMQSTYTFRFDDGSSLVTRGVEQTLPTGLPGTSRLVGRQQVVSGTGRFQGAFGWLQVGEFHGILSNESTQAVPFGGSPSTTLSLVGQIAIPRRPRF